MASILSIGVDKTLLAERHRMLRDAGFQVVPTGLGESFEPLASDPQFQVAIFGPFVPEAARNQAAACLLRNCRHIKIIMIYQGTIRKAEMADAVLSINVSCEDLVQTVHYLIDKQSQDRRGRGRSA
jgi:hypothetical protein